MASFSRGTHETIFNTHGRTHHLLACRGAVEAARRPNSPQKPTSRRMPRPPAEPARAARDGRRHAACSSLPRYVTLVAASGAPLVRSRGSAACSLTSDPLGRHEFRRRTFPRPPRASFASLPAGETCRCRWSRGRSAAVRTPLAPTLCVPHGVVQPCERSSDHAPPLPTRKWEGYDSRGAACSPLMQPLCLPASRRLLLARGRRERSAPRSENFGG